MGHRISSPSSDYEVQNYLGSGAYGAVTQCKKLATNETVALKVIKDTKYIEVAKKETEILQYMKGLGSDKFNIIIFNDSFSHVGYYCLEFEKLDINMLEFLQRRPDHALELKEIRPVVHQLATALDFLQDVGIVHADLKPENIMIVDRGQQAMRVKIIDFGLALKNPEEHTGTVLQTLWYRCPEVLLGTAFNEAIDVWSLGCITVEIFTGTALFPGEDEEDMMRRIVLTFGNPPEHLLNSGLHTSVFFNRINGEVEPCGRWTFRTAVETGSAISVPHRNLDFFKTLLIKASDENADESEQARFVDVVADMLMVDSAERISPSQILQHPFVTMSHLADNSIHERSSGSAGNKRQLVQEDVGESENRGPDDISAMRRKEDCDDAELTEGQASPSLSPSQKRQKDDAEPYASSDDSSPTKKRRIILNNQDVNLKKRRTDDEEASGSGKAFPSKKRKRGHLSRKK